MHAQRGKDAALHVPVEPLVRHGLQDRGQHRRISPRLPAMLVAVVLGAIPDGLPSFVIPGFRLADGRFFDTVAAGVDAYLHRLQPGLG